MINAREELIDHIKGRKVDYIKIAVLQGYDEEPLSFEGSLEEVLPRLDFVYDNGFGGQRLFGYVWYAGGTWSERGEYDGSEWWAYRRCPSRYVDVWYGY